MDAQTRFAALEQLPFRGRRNGGPTESSIGAVGQVREVLRSRAALGLLVRRDLKARYKDSALGFLWTLARPLTQLAIYVLVIGEFLGASRSIPGFPVYVYTGIAAYTFMSEMLSGGASSILANGGLVKKVSVPRELYPLASVGGAMFNFAVMLIILIIGTAALGVFPQPTDLLYAVPSIALLVIFGTAMAILLSAITVFLRDVAYLLDVVLMVMLWLSPILYSWGAVREISSGWAGGPILLEIYTDNPMTLAVLGMQRAFWAQGVDAAYPDLLLLRVGIACLVGLVLLVFGHWVFRRLQGNFAQEL